MTVLGSGNGNAGMRGGYSLPGMDGMMFVNGANGVNGGTGGSARRMTHRRTCQTYQACSPGPRNHGMAMLAQAASNRSPTVIKREQGTKNMLGTKNKAGLTPTSNNSVPPARMTHPKLTPNPRATRSEAEAVAPGIPVESTNIDVDGANDGMDESWNKGMTHGANDAMDATGGTRPRTANTPTAAAAVIADAPDKQTVVDGNEANQRTTPVAPPARVFAVAGMSCGGCTTAVCAVVLALPGTDSVQVSLESNSVRVRVPKLAYDDTCLPATATLPPPHSSPRTPPALPARSYVHPFALPHAVISSRVLTGAHNTMLAHCRSVAGGRSACANCLLGVLGQGRLERI